MKAKEKAGEARSEEERLALVATSQSLEMDTEPRIPSNISGLENFSLADDAPADEAADESTLVDADSLFNLPKGGGEDDQPE